ARFVNQLYQDILNRQADAAGLAFWTDRLDQGLTRVQVAASIENSTEHLTILVRQAFQQFLHPATEPAGHAFRGTFMQEGHTVEQMEAGIAGSAEYFQVRGGGTNDGFLTALYQDALGRAIDPFGQTVFSQQLAGGATTLQVASQVFTSTEFRQNLV